MTKKEIYDMGYRQGKALMADITIDELYGTTIVDSEDAIEFFRTMCYEMPVDAIYYDNIDYMDGYTDAIDLGIQEFILVGIFVDYANNRRVAL